DADSLAVRPDAEAEALLDAAVLPLSDGAIPAVPTLALVSHLEPSSARPVIATAGLHLALQVGPADGQENPVGVIEEANRGARHGRVLRCVRLEGARLPR